MGGFTSKTEQDLKLYLQRDYEISNYPSIISKSNKHKALVHQIITDSIQQAHKIRSDVNLYHHLKCQSISKVLEYIPLQSDKICSQQQYHYIVEQDLQKYNLKHQFLARKYYKERFSDQQILNIMKTYLCGLNVFHQKFSRKFADSLNLQSITVDQQHFNQLRLVDPLLKGQSTHLPFSFKQKQGTSNSKFIQNEQAQIKINIRQAPQKLQLKRTKFNEHAIQINELLADLFQVGILCLELHRMQLFNQYEKPQIILKQISTVSNRDIKKAIQLLTSNNPLQRGQVYDIIRVSYQEKYSLEKNLKKGKNKQDPSHINNIQNNVSIVKQNKLLSPQQVYKVQPTFSFGNSHFQPSPSFKPSESFSIPLNQQSSSLHIFNTERNKAGTISNLSTDRSLNQGILPVSLNAKQFSQQSYKPSIKFNNGNNSVANFQNVKIFSSSSSNLPPYVPNSSPYLHQYNSASILAKDLQTPRSNSYFIAEGPSKSIHKLVQYSPFKKQQNVSPISQKDQYRLSSDNNGYKQIFKKYSHLNFQPNRAYSPIKTIQNEKMQAQINRLLRGSINKPFEDTKNINSYSPIGGFHNLDSPISALQINSQATSQFAYKEGQFSKAIKLQQNSTNASIPTYRPNKQVQQILKRLGIGSLLYGNSDSNGSKEEDNSKQLQKEKKYTNKNQTQKQDIFVHKVSYNINKGGINSSSSHQKTEIRKQKPYNYDDDMIKMNYEDSKLKTYEDNRINNNEDIHDRQTTPIRPVNKAKYNSTIVQVGDQDSQYSSSGVRNIQNFNEAQYDLTNHQFVNQQYETGSRYQGYKLDNQRNGYGKFFYQDGGYYEGQWKNNKMDGFGRLYYQGGKLAYQGHWAKDQFHGFGKVYNDNPVKLQCGFDFTNFDLLQDYWQYYQGMLVKDTKQGRGKIKLTNDEIFEGDFHNDRIQGFGKFFLRQGNMIEGIWRDSKLIKIIN